jgi:hypothetical protein
MIPVGFYDKVTGAVGGARHDKINRGAFPARFSLLREAGPGL